MTGLTPKKIEPFLDKADIIDYQNENSPSSLKIRQNELVVKSSKTVDDWLELARLQTRLGKFEEAKKSLTESYKLDPVRTDSNSFYFRFVK